MRRPLLALLIAVAATGLATAAPPTARADEPASVTQTAATVVRLDPANRRLRVSITVKVANRTPDGVESYSCTKYTGGWWSIPYQSTCERAVRYYVDHTTVDVDASAVNLKATSGKKALVVTDAEDPDPNDAWRPVSIAFPRLFKDGKKSVVLTYAVRGGAPRSDATTRTLKAFARFCVVANGSTSGTVTVRAPKTFAMSTSGAKLKAAIRGTDRVFTSGSIANTAGWRACFTGTNAKAYRTENLDGPGGATIRLRSWPEDNDWADGVRDDVAASVPLLERLAGVAPAATGAIDIRETGAGTPYTGSFDGTTNTITIGEDFGEPALVEHELAHAWFNSAVFGETWLAEGYAEWAGRLVTGAEPCAEPSSDAAPIDDAHWSKVTASSDDAQRATAVSQYLAACYVVTAVANAAGEERMTTATIALLGRRDPYAVDGGGSGTRGSKVAGWREWLDAVDELALDPAGAPDGLAAGLLSRFGVAQDPALLQERADARRAHRTLVASVGWQVPAAVRAPLAAWKFDTAAKAIAAAKGTWEATGETDAILPGVDARNGVVAETWQGARTVADLRAVGKLADRQLASARDVAEARSALEQPLDLVQRVGMFATDIPGLDDAILAVRAGDVDAAAEASARIRESVAGLRAAGEQRIAVGATLALILLAGFGYWYGKRLVATRVRRAEARSNAAVVAVGTAQAWRAAPVDEPPTAPVPAGERFQPNPLDESPTQPWVPPPILVSPNMEGDPDLIGIARLIRPRRTDDPPPSSGA